MASRRHHSVLEWPRNAIYSPHSRQMHGSGPKFDHIRRHWLVCFHYSILICRLAFGHKHRVVVSILFSLELTATWFHHFLVSNLSVALVVLFADSLNALIPTISTTTWKLLSFVIFIPLSFVPLNILSYTSILGIIGTVGRTPLLDDANIKSCS